MKNSNFILIPVIFVVLFVAGCSNTPQPKEDTSSSSVADRIYNLDPQREFIGQNIEDYHFIDVITDKQVHLDELYTDKIVMIQSFSNGCPACVRGIAEYNKLYDNYGDSIEIIYMDISSYDDPEDIKAVKEDYNGRDWIWVNYQGSLLPFYEKYNFKLNDMTFILDKGGRIAYADSFSVPIERLENELKKLVQ